MKHQQPRPPGQPVVWALLGARRGDNNQVLALAEMLGLPFESKQLEYNWWRHLQPPLLGATFRSLTKSSREKMSGDPPDLTISAGHRSVPVVQALRQRSGGRTRSVHIGYPRISPGRFDLVIATAEYPIEEHPNLMRVPVALTRQPTGSGDATMLAEYPGPRRLLIVGGPTLYWRLDRNDVISAIDQLERRAIADGGSLWAVVSPRTPRRVVEAAQKKVAAAAVPALFAGVDSQPGYRALLDAADTITVTADSVAMVSDAVATGKPVELIPIRPTLGGGAFMSLMDRLAPGRRMRPRDHRFFWKEITRSGLATFAGTSVLDSSPLNDPRPEILRRVARLLKTRGPTAAK